MKERRNYITDFIGLDLLRFILSITVVIRHYYHFYGPYKDGPFQDPNSIVREQPFYSILAPIYNHGQFGVQVFWLISGLIFYAVYHHEILDKKISFGKFSFLRFSRLYPLHFLTLIVTALVQFYFYYTHNTFFVYQSNDFSHFFLQLFFMGSWFPTMDFSFNVPIWSISIEIFVYIFFWLITEAGQTRGNRLFVLIGIAMILNFYNIIPPFNGCLLYFFSGCLLAKFINEGVPFNKLLAGYVIMSVAIIVGVRLLKPFLTEEELGLHGVFLLSLRIIPIASSLVLVFIIAFRKITSTRIISLFKNLGNMTYSVYLVHFPLQVIIFLVLNPGSYTTFNNPAVLFGYLAVSMLTGWIAFTYFEKPAQKYLRAMFDQVKGPQEEVSQNSSQMAEANNQSAGVRIIQKGLDRFR